MPSADQSRCASSISLSDLEIQTARRRPLSQLSSRMPATWRPLPAPVPSPRNQPRRKRTAFSASSGAAATRSKVSSTVQEPARNRRMGLAGIDDGFELGVGQQAVGDDVRRQMRPIGGLRRRDRRHRGRLHELGRMRLGAGNTDRLQAVFFIERIGDAAAFRRRPVDGLVGEFDASGSLAGARRCRTRRMAVGRAPFAECADAGWRDRRQASAIGSRGGTCSLDPAEQRGDIAAPCPARPGRRSDRRRAACRSRSAASRCVVPCLA